MTGLLSGILLPSRPSYNELKKDQIRAFAGAFFANGVACEPEKTMKIAEKFSTSSDELLFLSGVAVILCKFGAEFHDGDSEARDFIHDFLNQMLRQQEVG